MRLSISHSAVLLLSVSWLTAPVLASSSSESDKDRGFLPAVSRRASHLLHRLSSHFREGFREQEVVVEEEGKDGGEVVRKPKKKKRPALRRFMDRARRARKRDLAEETRAARRNSSYLSAGASSGSPLSWQMEHDDGREIEYLKTETPASQERRHSSCVSEPPKDDGGDEMLVVEDEAGTSWGQSLASSPSPRESPFRLSLGEDEELDEVHRVKSARFASDEEMESDNWPVLPAEVRAFRTEFDHAHVVVEQAKESATQLDALRTALLGSQDFGEFVKRHRTLVGVVNDIETVFVRTINFSLYGALSNFREFAESAEGSADWQEECEMERVSFSHLREEMRAVLEEAKQRAALTSLDCYQLPFLGRTGHFIGDLDELVRETRIEADQILAAYQHFYRTLGKIIEEMEAIAPALAAMPEAYEKVMEGSSLAEYEQQQEALGAGWQRLQALFGEVNEATTTYREIVEKLDDNDTERADLVQHWKAQFRADENGMAALKKAFFEDNLALFWEFVGVRDVFIPFMDRLFGLDHHKVTRAQLTSEMADVKEAIREAEALHTALVTDAVPLRRVWEEMLEDKEMDEAKFMQNMDVLAEEKDWFANKLPVLMGKLDAAKAKIETAKETINGADPWKFLLEAEEIRLLTLLGRNWHLEISLPPLLDDKALTQTALIHAHPEKLQDMLGHLKHIRMDYISDEVQGSHDEEALDDDPVHIAFDRLHKDQMGLQDWDMLRLKGTALERVYRDALRAVPGSAEAFLAARRAFDRSWLPHYLAHKTLREDLQALKEAIAQVDEARQHEWKHIVDNYHRLLQPAAMGELSATASEFTLDSLRRHLGNGQSTERIAFLKRLVEIEMTLAEVENALALTKKKRQILLSAADEAEAIEAVSAFVRAGAGLRRSADSAVIALNGLEESPEYLAYHDLAQEGGAAAVLFRLDDEARLQLGARMARLQEAIPAACLMGDDELATVPGIRGNAQLFDDLRATIWKRIVYDDLAAPQDVPVDAFEVETTPETIEPMAGPSGSSHDAAAAEPSPPKTAEEAAFRNALVAALDAIALANKVITALIDVKKDLLASPDIAVFDQRQSLYSRGRDAFREATEKAEAAFKAANEAWVGFEDLFTWSEDSLYRMADWAAAKDGMATLGDAIKALRDRARGRAMVKLSTLDYYGLPFLRQGKYFFEDLSWLVKEYGIEADPVLQAYQNFSGALAAANEAAKEVVSGLMEMPQLYAGLADMKEKTLAAFLQQRDGLYDAWQNLQARFREATQVHQAYSEAISGLPAAKEEIVQGWQQQYQADTKAFDALVKPFQDEYRALYLEFVAPSHATLLSRLLSEETSASDVTADRLATEKTALERAQAMAIAMSVDAKLLSDLWAELRAETEEDAFEEKMGTLLEYRHMFNDQMDILRRRVEAASAAQEAAKGSPLWADAFEPDGSLAGIRDLILAIEEMLPPALDGEALAKTAFIQAHPERMSAVQDSLRASDHDYIEDAAPDDGDVDVEPVYMAYEELFSHQKGLQDWELLGRKAAALEQAYESALQLAPGSVDAFLAARAAFDRSWEAHYRAAQAVRNDLHALHDALDQGDETRQRYWAPTMEHAEGLLLAEPMSELEAAASKFTMHALIKEAGGKHPTPARKDFMKRLDNLQNMMSGLEDGLSLTRKMRRVLLASANDDQAITVTKGFAMATRGLIGDLAKAKEQYSAIHQGADKGARGEAARLDEEALRMLGTRLGALDEAIDEACTVSEKQLSEIPAVSGNDQLLRELRSIIRAVN